MIDGVSAMNAIRSVSATRSADGGVSSAKSGTDSTAGPGSGSDSKALTPSQTARVSQLRAVDRSVRAHEAAHQAAGGTLSGGMTLRFTQGPDGRSYAVAGEVQISLSSGSTPDQTIERMETVQRAATAPADPSAQDMRVASEARSLEQQARAEKAGKSGSEAEGAASAAGASSDRAARERAGSAYARADSIGRGGERGSVASVAA